MKSEPHRTVFGTLPWLALWAVLTATAAFGMWGAQASTSGGGARLAPSAHVRSPSRSHQHSLAPQDATKLVEGETVTKRVRAGVAEAVSVVLSAGQYARVVFVWRGIDLEASVVGPGGASVVGTPVPIRARGTVFVSFVAETAGEYRIEVRPLRSLKVDGVYAARLEAVR